MSLFSLLCVFSLALGASEVYKWVDENGIVHYSDKPPETQQSTEVDIQQPLPTGEAGAAEISAEAWLEQQRAERESEKQKKKELSRIAAINSEQRCKTARRMLSILEIQCPVFYDSQGVLRVHCPYQSVITYEGERRYIEDDVRTTMIERYWEQLENCGDAGR
jgi:hypothetical protein